MSAAAEARNNIPLAAALLGQIAKEMGGLFTNQRQITGRDERRIEFRDFSDMTDEAVDAHLAQLLADEGEEGKWR